MRTMKRLVNTPGALALLVLIAGAVAAARGQEDDLTMVTRVYQLADMILPTPQHEYRGDTMPTTNTGDESMGGLSPTSGIPGAAFNVRPGSVGGSAARLAQAIDPASGGMAAPAEDRLTMESLIQTIQACVEPTGWDANGGGGSMRALGTMLIVTHTDGVHKKLQEFMSDLRTQGGALRTVTISAWWLLLDSDQLAKLQVEQDGRVKIDKTELAKLAQADTSFRGQIACFSGQTVHIVSGKRRNVVTSVIPVVGSETAVGFRPVNSLPNVGALLQVRPTLLSGGEAAIVDIKSYVTESVGADETLEVHSQTPVGSSSGVAAAGEAKKGAERPESRRGGVVRVDRVNLKTQALGTTVRTSLGEPVLVGGLTDLPPRDDGGATAGEIKPKEGAADGLATKKLVRRGERPQLYLVMQVNLNDERKSPAKK